MGMVGGRNVGLWAVGCLSRLESSDFSTNSPTSPPPQIIAQTHGPAGMTSISRLLPFLVADQFFQCFSFLWFGLDGRVA